MDEEARIMEELTKNLLHEQDQEILKVFAKAFLRAGYSEEEAAKLTVELFTRLYSKPPLTGRGHEIQLMENTMTEDEIKAAVDEMKSLSGGEEDHIRADEILCEVLEKLGHAELVQAFAKINKWYA